MRAALLAALLVTGPAAAQLNNPPSLDVSGMATAGQLAAVQASIPTASTTAPPSVADAGAVGSMTSVYALANHTHGSKARKGRVLIPASGTLAVSFNQVFVNTPVCATTAETTSGDTNVVNAQIDGTPTTTSMTLRITRTAVTNATLLGLNILSVPTQVATYAHYICLEP